MTTVAIDDLRRFGRAVLAARGVPAQDAALVTDVMVEQDARGHGHHGAGLLALRVADLERGAARAGAVVEVLADLPAFTALDARGALGPVGAVQAMDACIQKARTQGGAFASLRDMPHWVIPAFYSMRAAAARLIGYCTCVTNPAFAPVGGRARALGNNPLSYAIPADPRPPIVVDFGVAPSTGRMRELAADGRPLPEGWAVDADGRPLRDPAQAMREGVFLPAAEHRGYGLGLVHEILGATLNAMPIGLDAAPSGPDAPPHGSDATPIGPDVTPGGPDAAPSGPDVTPVGPDAAPIGPDAAPIGPDAAPIGPDATPGGPDAAPGGPDATLVGSDATLVGSDAMPGGSDAAPHGPAGVPGRFGAFFAAWRVDTFRPAAEFLRGVNQALDRIAAIPPVDPARPVRYPGERSGRALRRNLARGRVELGTASWEQVQRVARRTNVPAPTPLT